jgi:hypothetical protein
MWNHLFDKKYVGDNHYISGWNLALENFQQLQSEEGKKRRKLKQLLKLNLKTNQ